MGNLKQFKADAWVHPKSGGDDYQTELTLDAYTRKQAEELIESWLAKRSDVTKDYRITSERVA